MDHILVSACLLGHPVRYDGKAKTLDDKTLDMWRTEGRLVSICPEIMAGLATPRTPAEIIGGQVVEQTVLDVTHIYVRGAEMVTKFARDSGCKFALLTDGSPSCGSTYIYDGTFTGQRIAGIGIVTEILRKNGIQVFSESQIHELSALLSTPL